MIPGTIARTAAKIAPKVGGGSNGSVCEAVEAVKQIEIKVPAGAAVFEVILSFEKGTASNIEEPAKLRRAEASETFGHVAGA